jgi:hypothetical protein
MRAHPKHSGISMAPVQDGGAPPEADTANPDLALARWENEGGLLESRSHRGRDTRTGTSVTDRANRFPGPITAGADADDGR